MKEVSAGGVVFFKNRILILEKYSGAWVLPKGGVERGGTLETAALREVKEEAGVIANIESFIGSIEYEYYNPRSERQSLKEVHWYLMDTDTTRTYPQSEEGFFRAQFVNYKKVIYHMAYLKEQSIVKKAIDMVGERDRLY